MRWLGSADRAQDIATDYARTREAFGKKVGVHEGVSFMLADNAMDIHLARLSIWHTAWVLDQGHRASHERIFRDTRAFRICDGPSEVHRWALGARIVRAPL